MEVILNAFFETQLVYLEIKQGHNFSVIFLIATIVVIVRCIFKAFFYAL